MDIHGGDTDFDLFWGMGPSSNSSNNNNGGGTDEQQQQQQHSNNNSSSGGLRSSHHGGGLGDIDVGSPSPGNLGGSRGSGSLDPSSTTLMGSFWSHGGVPHLEDYGHQHHVHVHAPSRPDRPASPRQTTAVRSGTTAAGGDAVVGSHSNGNSGGANSLEGKLEELAAAITSSVLGKLDVGVREALTTGQQQQQQLQHQQQQRGADSFAAAAAAPPPAASNSSSSTSAAAAQEESYRRAAAAAAEAAAAPLRSRLADLEEQVSRLTAAATNSSSSSRSGDSRSSRGGRAGGAGGGVGLGRGGGGGNPAAAVAATEPHVALTALAQRTGTLEGRHKQVQAKVALLDNAFGPKASDWAQTIKAFIQEREAGGAAGAGAAAPAAAAGGKGRGGKAAGKKRLDIDAPVFSPRSSASAAVESEETAAAGTASAASTALSVTGAKHGENESAPEVVGGGASPRDDRDGAGATARKREEAAGVVDRCAACSETGERCNRLEERVAELSLAQGKAAAAAAAAAADATKAREVAEDSRRDAAAVAKTNAERVSSLDLARRQQQQQQQQQRMPAPAAGAGGEGGGKWASKASVEKLAGELRQLLKRVKDGADALALVDYAVKDVRDEIAPLSGTVSALKRLVETQLREKGQAAELLKGYVTTITREVAAITRQYINGLVAPGVLAAAAAANKIGGGGDAVLGTANTAAVPAASAVIPTIGGGTSPARVPSMEGSSVGGSGAVSAGAEGNNA